MIILIQVLTLILIQILMQIPIQVLTHILFQILIQILENNKDQLSINSKSCPIIVKYIFYVTRIYIASIKQYNIIIYIRKVCREFAAADPKK